MKENNSRELSDGNLKLIGGGRLKAPECAYLSPVKKSVKGFEIQLLGRLVAAEAWQLPNLQLSTKIAVFLFQI